jgi:hypothetical protein
MHTTKRSVTALAGIVAGLAIAAPIADASTATTPAAFAGSPLPSFVGPPAGAMAIGPTVIGTVFNGATVVQVVNGPTLASINGSP